LEEVKREVQISIRKLLRSVLSGNCLEGLKEGVCVGSKRDTVVKREARSFLENQQC
jgi:hypothetical protein